MVFEPVVFGGGGEDLLTSRHSLKLRVNCRWFGSGVVSGITPSALA